jgi:hypothetical protein
MHRPVDHAPAHRNQPAAYIERLLVQAALIDNQIAIVKCSVDRVFDRLSHRFLTAMPLNERLEIVPWLAEYMAAPVRVVHASRRRLTPSAAPARARR